MAEEEKLNGAGITAKERLERIETLLERLDAKLDAKADANTVRGLIDRMTLFEIQASTAPQLLAEFRRAQEDIRELEKAKADEEKLKTVNEELQEVRRYIAKVAGAMAAVGIIVNILGWLVQNGGI